MPFRFTIYGIHWHRFWSQQDRPEDGASISAAFGRENYAATYAHSVSADRMTAQGEVLQAILGGATPARLNAD